MSQKKRRLKKRHSTILMIVFAVAVCYFLISFIVMQSDIKSQEKYNAQLRTQLADKKAENEELEKLMLKNYLALDEGYIFGTNGSGFERWNLALPKKLLADALDRLYTAVNSL